jgi:hypothetical protein
MSWARFIMVLVAVISACGSAERHEQRRTPEPQNQGGTSSWARGDIVVVKDTPFAPRCDGDAPSSDCSTEETCLILRCGGFELDLNGCYRPTCASTKDCGSGERCWFASVRGATADTPASCITDQENCICVGSGDHYTPSRCVDSERFPASEDCRFESLSCEELERWFLAARAAIAPEPSIEEAVAIADCQLKWLQRASQLGCTLP